jgi:gamma-glutamyltranspeptidase/glutathione hydrolase
VTAPQHVASRAPTPASVTHGIVSSVEGLAAEAGARMLRMGGNAADAAVATAFAQGVVDPIYCGIGGGFHGLFHDGATGRTKVVTAGGHAPLAARADMWRPASRWGAMWEVEGQHNRLGYQASMVPGFVRGAAVALDRFGSGVVTWSDVLQPSIELAAEGFEVYPYLYRIWMPATGHMNGFLESLDGPTVLGHTPASREIFLKEDGSVYDVGDRLVQRDLATTLERLARDGADDFYVGGIADQMVRDFAEHGGLLSAEDLSGFEVEVEDPVTSSFRGLTVMSEPAPTVGVITLEILNIIEDWDLASLGWNTAPYLDRLARAMHAGFRDRMVALGDPRFVEVDEARFLSKDYARSLRETIEREADEPLRPVDGSDPSHQAPHRAETTHVSVLDEHSNAAAITHSVGMSSGVVTPGLGFQHNCHMVMFDPVPGQRNSIAPGKRPITGGGPVLFTRDGVPSLVIGSPAGARKVTALVQTVLSTTDFGMSLQEAVSAPRIHTEDEARTIVVEPSFPSEPLVGLARLGNRIRYDWYSARLAAVARRADGVLEGGSDPRGDMGLQVV